jgi:DNA polymerase-4
VSAAKRLCPEGVFRRGDLDTYARVSDDVTNLLLSVSRRVERPSADEAYVDLTRESPSSPGAVAVAESLKDDLQRRLGLDASLGLACSRLAARVASSWARPRGLLVVLPGYEASFLARQPLCFLPELPPHLERGLEQAGLVTLGQVAACEASALAEIVGAAAATRLQEAARGECEEAVAVTAPPVRVQEEAVIRDRRTDRVALRDVVEGLAARAWRRLRPFGLVAGTMTVELKRADTIVRREENVEPGLADEETARAMASGLVEPVLDPASGVRSVQVRLSRLGRPGAQASLFSQARGVSPAP